MTIEAFLKNLVDAPVDWNGQWSLVMGVANLAIIRKSAGTFWVGVGNPHAYSPVKYVLIDLSRAAGTGMALMQSAVVDECVGKEFKTKRADWTKRMAGASYAEKCRMPRLRLQFRERGSADNWITQDARMYAVFESERSLAEDRACELNNSDSPYEWRVEPKSAATA